MKYFNTIFSIYFFLTLTIIIFTINIANSFSTWQCGTNGKYTCSKDNTCCKNSLSVTGFKCFPLVEGICCKKSDMICPKGTYCNIKDNACEPITQKRR